MDQKPKSALSQAWRIVQILLWIVAIVAVIGLLIGLAFYWYAAK